MQNFYDQLAFLPANLSNHLLITIIPLIIGVCLSLPLAIYIVKHPRWNYPTLTVVSIIQTIPSLALLALMVPVLVGIGSFTSWAFGIEISALGFYPTVIALTLYSILPMLRNAVTGIQGVDPAVVEAAQGVGMTPRQILWQVEFPLAAPVIIAGIRTATVWVVGIATLATPVGQRCLGNYIFSGLQTRNWTAVLFGCIAAALLAMLLDTLIGGIEKAVKDRNRKLGIIAGGLLCLLLTTGIAFPLALQMKRSSGIAAEKTIWIGAKTFTEQYILMDLLQKILEEQGIPVRKKESLGSTIVFDALANGEIDCYVDYSGTIWANYMNRTDTPGSQEVLDEMTAWLRENHGIVCLGSLGFENAYCLAMREDRADEMNIRSMDDLAPHSPKLKIGGDYEFFGRPEWKTIRDIYNLNFSDLISYDSTFMYTAVVSGQVDVISAFSSDGRIAAFDLRVLDDPQNAIPPYDAVLLLSRSAAERIDIVQALQPLVNSVPVEMMREANYRVDRNEDQTTVEQAAQWMHNRIFEEN